MAAAAHYIVAVVDDDNRVLQSLGDLLESDNYTVRLYSSADELLQSKSGVMDLDCLISDIDIPGMNGFELQRAAKAEKPGLPVILITGQDNLAKRAGIGVDRADGLFQKPFNSKDLLAAVAKAVGALPRN